MSLVSPTQVSDGTTADASDVNTPINQLAAVINGNIDNSNIVAGAAIDGSKLANSSIDIGAKASVFDGWVGVTDSWTYASATTVTVPSDATTKYAPGDKVKFSNGSTKYFTIQTVASTLLTFTGGSYTVANSAISAIYYSKVDTPQTFPGPANPYKFSAYQTSDQSITQNSLTTLNLGTELFDTNSNLSGAVYTAPVNGFYSFFGRVSVIGLAGTGAGIGAYLYLNGSTHIDGIYWYDNSVSLDFLTDTASTLIQLTAGDTITLKAIYLSNNGSNGTLNAGRQYNSFSGFLVSRT